MQNVFELTGGKEAEQRQCSSCGRFRPRVLFPCSTNSFCQACFDAAMAHRGRQEWKRQSKYLRVTIGFRAHRLLDKAKVRAANAGLPFDLNTAWLAPRIRAGRCEVTRIPFELNHGYRGPFSPSLDRIEPSLGYTMANCRLVVWIYNCAKSTWTDADVRRMAEAMTALCRQNPNPSTHAHQHVVPARISDPT